VIINNRQYPVGLSNSASQTTARNQTGRFRRGGGINAHISLTFNILTNGSYLES
jgi:hypothetical protein